MSLGQHERNEGVDKQLLSYGRRSLWEGKHRCNKTCFNNSSISFHIFFSLLLHSDIYHEGLNEVSGISWTLRSFWSADGGGDGGIEGGGREWWRREQRDYFSPTPPSLHTYTHGSSQSGVLRRQSPLSQLFEMKDAWPFFKGILSP